ncbi:MAG: phosphoribosylglycinamide formyltransferase, partial [Dolichospermum sp.]
MTYDLTINNHSSLISPDIYNYQFSSDQPLKIGIMASGNGSNFEVIAQAIADGKINAKIQVLIYNNPDAKAAIRAEKWGVESVLLNHRDYKSREKFDSKIVQILQQYDVKFVIMAGWMRLVTQVLIDAFPQRMICFDNSCCIAYDTRLPAGLGGVAPGWSRISN